MSDRYRWQVDATKKFVSANSPPVFFVEACPGAGKTIFSLSVAVKLQKQDPNLRIVVVSPTDNVREKFCEVAQSGFGIELKGSIPTGYPRAYDGISCTYAGLSSRIDIMRCWGLRFITVLDEVHHCDHDEDGSRAWGEAAVHLQSMSTNAILLSGTPFRSCGSIPFLDQCRDADHQFVYPYSQGIADGVVRPVSFLMEDSPWSRVLEKPKGKVVFDGSGFASSDDDKSHRNHAIFRPGGDWVSQTIIEAVRNIDEKRASGDQDAAALFVCRASDQQGKPGSHAKAIARRVYELTGEEPELVLSDLKGSSDRITDFVESKKRFIVSVAMVSEGVDIPRIRCIALMCSIESPLRFRQVVGRAVRYESNLPRDQKADILLPKFPSYQTFAAEIEKEVEQGKKDRPPEPPKPKVPTGDEPEVGFLSTSTSRRGEDIEVLYREDDLTEYLKAAKLRNPNASDDMNMSIAISDFEHDRHHRQDDTVNPERGKQRYRKESDRLIKRIYFQSRGTEFGKLFSDIKDVHLWINKQQDVQGVDDLHDNHGWERMKERRDILKVTLDQLNGGSHA